MSPKIYEFTDLSKAINYYRTIQTKLEQYCNSYPRIWYEVTLQSSNLRDYHLVTLHIGVQKELDADKNIQGEEFFQSGMFDF
jgi:hypothetical protein